MWYWLVVNEGILTVKNKFHVFASLKTMILYVIRGWVVNFFHCLYNPTPKTKIWFNLYKLKIITNVKFSVSLSFIPFVISPKYIIFYVCRNSKWASLAQYWVNALFYMHNSMEVWFRVILEKFLWIKGSNLQQMFSPWLSFTWSCWIVFLFLGWGYTGGERNLSCTPPIMYKIVIFRDVKAWTLF